MNTSLSREDLQLAIQSWLPDLTQAQLAAVYGMMHAFVKPALQKEEASAAEEAELARQPEPGELRESMFSRISRIVNPAIEPKED